MVSHGDDIGDDAEFLVTPQVAAQAAEAGLHLVGNEVSSGGVNVRESLRHESGRHRRQPFAREGSAIQKACEAHARCCERVDRAFDLVGVSGRELLVGAPCTVPVRVHHGHRAHIRPALVLGVNSELTCMTAAVLPW